MKSFDAGLGNLNRDVVGSDDDGILLKFKLRNFWDSLVGKFGA